MLKIFNEKNIFALNILSSIFVITLLALSLSYLFYKGYFDLISSNIDYIEKDFIEQNKEIIKSSTDELIGRIEFERSILKTNIQKALEQKVNEALNISSRIYENNKYIKSVQDIKPIIIDTLKTIWFFNSRGYYFIYDENFKPILFNNKDEFILSKSNPLKNPELFKNQNDTYLEYLCASPLKDSQNNLKKVSYIKYFQLFKWYVGCGEYIEYAHEDIKKEIIDSLNSYTAHRKRTDYFFAYQLLDINGGDWFAKMLVNPNKPELIGKTLSDAYKDAKGSPFRKTFMKDIRAQGDSFVHYWYEKPGTGEIKDKIAYFKLYKPWQWIIARGFYLEDLNEIIDSKKKEYEKKIYDRIKNIVIVFILFLLLSFLLSFFISKGISKLFAKYQNKIHKRNNELQISNENLKNEIQERIRIEEELKTAKYNAEAANRAKSNFLANISHEIRTPMNGVIGSLDLLLKKDLNKKQEEFVEIAKTSANMLLAILNDILDFSKVESGQLKLENNNFSIIKVIKHIEELMTLKADEKNLNFKCCISEDVPELIIGDPLRLRQIIVNIVSNAIKFTDKGNVDLWIDIEKETDEFIILNFIVSDTGIGIPKDKIDHLFKSFSQIDDTRTRKYGGTGIGLAISKQLIELMDGDISIKSEIDKGSTFQFSIKFKKKFEDFGEFVRNDLPDLSKAKLDKDIKILIIENNEFNQLLLQGILENNNIQSDIVSNNKEAILTLSKNDYHLALLDMDTKTNGFEILKTIRDANSNVRNNKIPIIAMMPNVKDEIDQETIQNINTLVNDNILKPVKHLELINKIVKILG